MPEFGCERAHSLFAAGAHGFDNTIVLLAKGRPRLNGLEGGSSLCLTQAPPLFVFNRPGTESLRRAITRSLARGSLDSDQHPGLKPKIFSCPDTSFYRLPSRFPYA